MLINTYLDTEDFVHLYYAEDETAAPAQGCGAGARMASKYPPRPRSPEYSTQVSTSSTSDNMTDRERYRAPPPPEPPPHRVRAADLYPRTRPTYDEPGLDAGFTQICGEFVQWIGRTADGGTISLSNYRLHIQPRRRAGAGTSVPVRLIDAVEISEMLHLVVLCKHGLQLKCTFSTGEQVVEWSRRLTSMLGPIISIQDTFAAAYAAWAKEQPHTSVHRHILRESNKSQRHWFGPEVERMEFTKSGAWRVTAVNAEYKLCMSYPPMLVVPASIGDEELDSAARFRSLRRIPTAVWRHRGTGAVLARSSQPEVGWFGWRSSEDERLLAAFVSAAQADRPANGHTNKPSKLLIVDARSYASAVTNRARGGGCECIQYYPAADIQFMSLPNIHHVRRSFHQLRALCAEPSDIANWYSSLERTLWPGYVSGVLRASGVAARAVLAGRPVLVHCSDGWDRTPQILATAMIMLDPYYRTIEGFRVLIEREWLDFGHKFADRCGHSATEEPNERAPIFLQWLDVVHQIMSQYPCSFEFNDALLIKLATHVHSCMFGTFLLNTMRERREQRLPDLTASVWPLLLNPHYRNHLYAPPTDQDETLWPQDGVRYMRLWFALFCGGGAGGAGGAAGPGREERPPQRPRDPPTHNGLMTKTRSCDNLLGDGEKKAAQRRCSDPNIAPDALKLSSMSIAGGSGGAECRSALTDSCVDQLPALANNAAGNGYGAEQVDLHPDHFEASRSHDLASDSSSLERELAGAADPEKPTDLDGPGGSVADLEEPVVSVGDLEGPVVSVGDLTGPDGSVGDLANEVEAPPTVEGPATPDDAVSVFVCDAYGMAEAARENGRARNISITWRSVSESSSNGYDLPDAPQPHNDLPINNINSHKSSPIDLNNHNSTEGDEVNHNVVMTNHNRPTTNGVNGLSDVTSKFLENDINGGGTSSSMSSESECESGPAPRVSRSRVPSQLTLCPSSPRRQAAHSHHGTHQTNHGRCHCAALRRASATSGIETSGESVGSGSSGCWCAREAAGASGGPGPAGAVGGTRCACACAPPGPDAVDGLCPVEDRAQSRLHQIITYQRQMVDELTHQLRETRAQLKREQRAGSPAARPSPSAPSPSQMTASSAGSASAAGSAGSSRASRSLAGSASGSSSASELEVGEDARGVVWLPDSAAPRCQHCRSHFWLARRRHHCRRCGGIFCGSCSEMSSWGDCTNVVRMCRRCRTQR